MNTFINIDEKARILIVSPHPDDETIGCGGILAKYGSQCDVVVLTDGRLGMSTEKKQSEEELAEIRKREFESAMQFFKIIQKSLLCHVKIKSLCTKIIKIINKG